MDEDKVFGICIATDGTLVTICELTEAGKKHMEDGGSPEMWEEWSEWFPLEDLIERIQ